MNKPLIVGAFLGALAQGTWAQSCEGGLYLNPQSIRGEATSQADGALRELVDFIKPTGLPVTPVLNINGTQDLTTALKRPVPPCWVYGNPVVGLASGYRPVAVNTEEIRAAVLVLGDVGPEKDGKAVDVATLPPAEREKILAKLKSVSCFGIRSGVTTSLVKAQKLCGTVVEVQPQQGLGQNYLPTKAAFHWQPERWAGLVTRVQGAMKANMKEHFGSDERIHNARLYVVPTTHASWGYGLYVRSDLPADAVKRAAAQFHSLKGGNPLLLRALDVGAKFEFVTPPAADVDAMRKVLDLGS